MKPSRAFKLSLAAALTLAVSHAPARAGDVKETARYNLAPAPRIAAPPKIDGAVDKAEWYSATLLPRLISAADGSISAQRSRVYVAYDDANLYVAFQIDRPVNALLPDASDTFALELDPAHEHKAAAQFSGNGAGAAGGKAWQYKARTTDFGWEGEMAIPFKSLNRATPKPGEVWGLDFLNKQATPVAETDALSHSANRIDARDFNHVVFTNAGPVVRFRETGPFQDESAGGASIELVNFGAQPADAVVSLEVLHRKNGAEGGSSTYLKGIAQATATRGDDLILPAEDLAVMVKEHAARYEPAGGAAGGAKLEKTLALPGNQRVELRATQHEPGDYLCRYSVKAGDQLLAAGVAPFTLSAPLNVTVQPFYLSPKIIVATADLRRVPEWVKGAKLRFAIVQRGKQEALVASEQPFDGSPKIVKELSTAALTPGGYELTTELTGADGKRKALLAEGFTKPADPAWLTKPVMSDAIVPPPWTPIKATDTSVSFLMGDYQLGRTTWPQQINAQSVYEDNRHAMLRAPMSLKGRVNGKEIAWSATPAKSKARRNEIVEIEGEQKFESLSVKSSVSFEYDGMAKVVLDLASSANEKATIDELWLDVPLSAEASKLFHTAPTAARGLTNGRDRSGAIGTSGTRAYEFMFSVWLGDEVRGFRWFAENWQGWRLDEAAKKQAIEIVASPEGATLRIHFFKGRPGAPGFALDKPRQIIFGYQFTPARSMDKRLFLHTMFHDRYEYDEMAGVNVAESWYYKYQGWPEIYSEEERAKKLADAKYSHAHGIAIVPYSGWYIARDSDVYKAFGGEMTIEPNANAGCGCDQNCWNTAVADAYASLLADRVRDTDIDGYRMDAGFSAENCKSLVHRGYGSQCGWIDDDGVLQPSRGIFAARKAAQRVYRIFHGGVKDNGWCLHHIHQGNRYDAILSHQDAVVSAEGPELTMTKLSEYPLDYYRAFVMGDAHGYRVIYLPKSANVGVDARYGLSIIHNLIPRGNPPVAMREVSNSRSAWSAAGIWRAYEWVDIADMKKTELWGYWRNAEYLSTGNANLVGTFWVRRGEKVLLGILNRERAPVESTITLDFAKLGFGKQQLFARDANTFEEIPVENNGVRLSFTPEGYRLIEFATKPIDPWTPQRISANLIPEISPATWDAKAIASQWHVRIPENGVAARNSEIVLESDGSPASLIPNGNGNAIAWRKIIPNAKKGQHYMLEAEIHLDCGDDVYLSREPEKSNFTVSLGEVYWNHVRSYNAQMAPGKYETVRLWFTVGDQPPMVNLLMGGKGRVAIRKLEVYEIQAPPPRPGMVAR